MKTCRQCNIEKDLSNFYVHKAMLDGYLNKCKECVKARIAKHRELNIDYINDYDKKRAMLPHRVKAREEYRKTENGKNSIKKAHKFYKQKFPMVYAAHVILSNSIKYGKIEKQFLCSECGNDNQIQAHHDDYTKPLDVRWLCVKCHNKWHKNNKPIYF
jgi:ribosomal protein S27AE